MNSTFFISNNLPEQTNVIMGLVDDVGHFNKRFDELTDEQKKVQIDLINLIGAHATINLIGFNSSFDCNIVAPISTELDIVDVDFSSLNPSERNIIVKFYQMISEICE
jgi:hypothetical protein